MEYKNKIEIFGFQNQETAFVLHRYISSTFSEFYTNWHKEIEFVYTVEGSETICIENDSFVTKPGDIVVINSGRIHTGTSTNWVHHCLIPSNEILHALGIDMSTTFLEPHIRDPQIAKSFLQIVNEYESERAKYGTQFKNLAAQQFLLQIFEKYETNRLSDIESKRDPNFAVTIRVIDFLRRHLATDFSIDEIAQEIGITSSYMCRCVKKATGISIIEHLNMLRCYTARHYILHSDKKISEIAELCGYQSNSYFAKTYQKIIGYSPNETPRKAGALKNNNLRST